MAGIYYKGDAEYKDGTAYAGGGGETKSGDDAYGAVRALEATTGKLKWEFKLLTPSLTGLLSTGRRPGFLRCGRG